MNKRIFKILFFLFITLLITSKSGYSQTKEIELAKHYAYKEEYDKAIELYSKLEKKKLNILRIHKSYFKLLVDLGKWDKAEKYINKVIKWYSNHSQYWVDKGMIYLSKGDTKKTESYFDNLMKQANKQNQLNMLANQFANNRLFRYSIKAYLMLEEKQGKKNSSYSLQIATLYAITNQKEKMIERYISYVDVNPQSYTYIQNMMQSHLSEKKDKDKLRQMLLEKIQKNHKRFEFREILLWLNLQEQDYNAAFIQAKALDLLLKTAGERSEKVAQIACNNKQYLIATDIYKYLVEKYKNTPKYIYYRKNMIKNKEKAILSNKDKLSNQLITELIDEYQGVIAEAKNNNVIMQVKKDQAYLIAFYLHDYEKAISILKDLLNSNPTSSLKAEVNILLADIYIIQGDMWEPTLLYYQVEKEQKETEIGRQARFNNARLSFFRSDFDLAIDQLNVLKIATSQKIANDALDLILLIKENTNEEDNKMLKSYANIELLAYQNRNNLAIDSLNYYISNRKAMQMEDEMLFFRAKLNRRKKEYKRSIADLTNVVDNYNYEILADDALFLRAKIYESDLKDIPKAMESYQKLIKEYPASFYADESRQKFRKLRGDKL